MNTDEDLWCLLVYLDRSWELIEFTYEFVLRNKYGQEVHANTLRGALEGALALTGAN